MNVNKSISRDDIIFPTAHSFLLPRFPGPEKNKNQKMRGGAGAGGERERISSRSSSNRSNGGGTPREMDKGLYP